jgi:hypothetical protein
MIDAQRELLEVLGVAKSLLALPRNDFAWSPWKNADEALREINELIGSIERGVLPKQLQLRVLFAPTGSIQEVSVSSGWGDEFLTLAKRFDAAEARLYDPLGTRFL